MLTVIFESFPSIAWGWNTHPVIFEHYGWIKETIRMITCIWLLMYNVNKLNVLLKRRVVAPSPR